MNQFQIECTESKTPRICEQYGKFIIEPLEPGQGLTIGNALRRTILSDLEGTAIVAVRIAGVNHEFSSIPGVREDILEILLNLKEIVLKKYSNKPQIGRLRIQGPAVITAGLFELPSDIEVIDPCQYIATIYNNNVFEMEFRIENGKGYRLIDKETHRGAIDFLQMDAIFMPVRKVNYKIQESKRYSQIIQERLIFEIWTNGSIAPHMAITKGADALTNLFYPLKNISFKPISNIKNQKTKKVIQIPIEELQLSVRAYNCLKRAQIHSVADLLDYAQEELLEIKNFGHKSVEEVTVALHKRLGINLPKEKMIKST